MQHKVDVSANAGLMDLAAQQSFMYDQHRAQQLEPQQQQLEQQQLRTYGCSDASKDA